MTRYVWRDGNWVDKPKRSAPAGPHIWNDLPAYKSPLGTGMIEGRYARREDLARGNCREVDPSERIDGTPKTQAQAAAERRERESWQQTIPPEIRERLMRGR